MSTWGGSARTRRRPCGWLRFPGRCRHWHSACGRAYERPDCCRHDPAWCPAERVVPVVHVRRARRARSADSRRPFTPAYLCLHRLGPAAFWADWLGASPPAQGTAGTRYEPKRDRSGGILTPAAETAVNKHGTARQITGQSHPADARRRSRTPWRGHLCGTFVSQRPAASHALVSTHGQLAFIAGRNPCCCRGSPRTEP